MNWQLQSWCLVEHCHLLFTCRTTKQLLCNMWAVNIKTKVNDINWISEGSPLMSASKDLLGCSYLCAKLKYCKNINLPNPFSAVFILHSRWISLMDLFVLVTDWGLSTSTEERRMLSSEINTWQYDAQAFPVRAGSIFRPDALVVIFKVT